MDDNQALVEFIRISIVNFKAVPARGESWSRPPHYLAFVLCAGDPEQVRLIDAALAASPGGHRDWGVCTECGMGRVDRDDVPALLDLHRESITAP